MGFDIMSTHPVHAGTRFPRDRLRPPDRRARHRAARTQQLSRGHQWRRLRRRSDGGLRPRPQIHPSAPALHLHRAGRASCSKIPARRSSACARRTMKRCGSIRCAIRHRRVWKPMSRSGWVDGLLASSVKKLEINGLPAVVAVARAGEWNFRLARHSVGGLCLSPDFRGAVADGRGRQALHGVHHVIPTHHAGGSARGARDLRFPSSRRAWETPPESLAAQMTTPNRPLEYFRLLNGLDENEPLIPGERYKIVTE